jgi:hypothetical protein
MKALIRPWHTVPVVVLMLAGLPACEGMLPGGDELIAEVFLPAVTVVTQGDGEEYGPELFPATAGDTWSYFGASQYRRVAVTDRTQSMPGVETNVWEVDTNGGEVEHFLRVTSDGVFDYGGLMGRFYAAPVPRLHFPVRVGKSWEMADEAAHVRVVATVEGTQPVGTARGLFTALRVRYDVADTDADSPPLVPYARSGGTWWFVPGLGVVKSKEGSDTFLLRDFAVSGFEEERQAALLE